jgi:hypothetical protein
MSPIEEQYDRQRAEKAFLKEMENRQYGEEETRDAWGWFIAGWVASAARIPDRKEYQHGRNFFQGEGQEEANAKVDGWNECRREALK